MNTATVELDAHAAIPSSTQLVREAYLPTFSPEFECLVPDEPQDVDANWQKVPTGGALWAGNTNAGAKLLGFRPASLADGTRAADVGLSTDVGRFTFDRHGNVWAVRGTVSSAALNFHAAADFSATGTRAPSRTIELSGVGGCTPNTQTLAFDERGDLWVASLCDDKVFKVAASALRSSGEVTPSATFNVASPGGLAFDHAGSLYVASRADGRIYRYSSSQLAATTPEPSANLGVRSTDDTANTAIHKASFLAFDASGALWLNDFEANAFARVAVDDLSGSGAVDVQPQVRVVVGVLAVLDGFAFDEEGGLWSAGAQGQLIRLSPSQLTVSSTSGAPTTPERTITSEDIGSARDVAFYPAPAALPLFHALP